MTQVIDAVVFVGSIVLYKKTDFTFDELGLKIRDVKGTLLSSLGVSALFIALLSVVKLILLKTVPGFFAADAPFWNWNLGLYNWTSYLFTCVVQEFLARSMIYGSIKKMFDGKHSVAAAIILSSLLFGAVHLAHGFVYMMCAIILLGSLGGLYEKHRNIWGVALIHYVLGEAATCLGFLS